MKLRSFALVICLTIASFTGLLLQTEPVSAAQLTLLRAPGSSDIWVRIPSGRYKVSDQRTFDAWGFQQSQIEPMGQADINAIPRGPDLTRALRPFGEPTVYVAEAGKLRAVTSEAAFLLAGYSWSEVRDVERYIVDNTLQAGANLIVPTHIRDTRGNLYYVEGGVKRPMSLFDWQMRWAFGDPVLLPNADAIPTGPRLTLLVKTPNDPTVWVMDAGRRRGLPSQEALLLNDFTWGQLSTVSSELLNSMPVGDIYWAPTTVRIPGDSRLYMVYGGARYEVISDNVTQHWGFGRFASRTTQAAAALPLAGRVTRLIRTESGTVYRITDQGYKAIPSEGVFLGYGFNWVDVANLPIGSFSILNNQGVLAATSTTLTGPSGETIEIPATAGKTGKEQHLFTTNGENTNEAHYAIHNTPQYGEQILLWNGVAGTGAFGRISPQIERWYITMRWNYAEWFEAPPNQTCSGNAMSTPPGRPQTCTRNASGSRKSWHLGKRVIVRNPANGRALVAAVGEAGPAIWVTREQGVVSGLSPEGTDYLVGAAYNSNGQVLEYAWSVDQSLPYGPYQY